MNSEFERIEIHQQFPIEENYFSKFKMDFGNLNFQKSLMTYFSLVMLVIIYPVITIGTTDDPTALLKNLNEGMLLVLLLFTIAFQWFIFGIIYLSTWLEKTFLEGIGIKKIRAVDFAWAISFLMAANLILTGLAWVLAQIGLPMPGEIALLIPKDPLGRVVWVIVSFTAGFCEETAFRGYLMTRFRLLSKVKGWVIPIIVSSVIFGACHAYQGWPGFIIISTYGIMFAVLYVRTKTLWPCVIAHSLQDLSALFFPQ